MKKPVEDSDIEMMEVLDSTASVKFPKRTHEVLTADGGTKSYTFTLNERLTVPYAHAMQFLRVPSFRIYEPGSDVPYDPTPVEDVKAGPVKIGQTMARFDEMTHEALLMRAAGTAGGEGFNKRTSKADLVDFLIGQQKRGVTVEADRAPESDDAEEFDPPPFGEGALIAKKAA